MKTFILAGFQQFRSDREKLAWLLDIEQQFEFFVSRNYELGVVIDTKHGDEIIRICSHSQEFDLVFDTNDEPTFISNFQSALYGANKGCFILPAGAIYPDIQVKRKLEKTLYACEGHSEYHLLIPHCPVEGKIVSGYPVLATERGVNELKSLTQWQNIFDPRVLVRVVPILDWSIREPESTLARAA